MISSKEWKGFSAKKRREILTFEETHKNDEKNPIPSQAYEKNESRIVRLCLCFKKLGFSLSQRSL